MHVPSQAPDLSSLHDVIGAPAARRVGQAAPAAFDAASGFWSSAFESKHLSPRVKELVLIAIHASVTSVNEAAVARHVQRARQAGASEGDILDVLLSIVGLANHALYFAVPILMDELEHLGQEGESAMPPMRPDVEAIKQDFIKTRGMWDDNREPLARLMPDYFKALSTLSMEPWKSGSLLPKEREFVYIAIDSAVTHMHEYGLRKHIQNAVRHGATREEILEVFHLVSLAGMEGYILGCKALVSQ